MPAKDPQNIFYGHFFLRESKNFKSFYQSKSQFNPMDPSLNIAKNLKGLVLEPSNLTTTVVYQPEESTQVQRYHWFKKKNAGVHDFEGFTLEEELSLKCYLSIPCEMQEEELKKAEQEFRHHRNEIIRICEKRGALERLLEGSNSKIKDWRDHCVEVNIDFFTEYFELFPLSEKWNHV